MGLVSPTTLLLTALDFCLPGGFSRSSTLTLSTRETPTLMGTCTVLKTMTMAQEHSELVLMLGLPEPLLELRFSLLSKELLMVDLTSLTPRRDSLDMTARASLSMLMFTGLTSSGSTWPII